MRSVLRTCTLYTYGIGIGDSTRRMPLDESSQFLRSRTEEGTGEHLHLHLIIHEFHPSRSLLFRMVVGGIQTVGSDLRGRGMDTWDCRVGQIEEKRCFFADLTNPGISFKCRPDAVLYDLPYLLGRLTWINACL